MGVRQRVGRLLVGAGLAVVLAGVAGAVTVRAEGGPYRPEICGSLSTYDILWWYFECWLPSDPNAGVM